MSDLEPDYLNQQNFYGGWYKDVPLPHQHYWPAGTPYNKRKAYFSINVYYNIGRHYHISFRLEQNPYWNPDRQLWQKPWDYDEHFSEFEVSEGASFDFHYQAKVWAREMLARYCQPLEDFEIVISDNTIEDAAGLTWFYTTTGD